MISRRQVSFQLQRFAPAVRIAFAFCIGLPLLAREEVWTVGQVTAPISIEIEGMVEISRASVETIRPGSPRAVVAWIGPDGKRARFGDELLRLDSAEIQRRHAKLLQDLAVLKERNENRVRIVERSLVQAEETLMQKMEDLGVKFATARATAAPDESKVATLRREIDLAKRQAVALEADLVRKRNLFELGEVARVEIEDAELATAAARRRVRIAELALVDAGDGSDPVLARRAAWLVERARVSIGTDDEGHPLETRGEGRKLAAIEQKFIRLQTSVAQEIEAAEVEIQAAARAAWAHFPLQDLRILDASGQEVQGFSSSNDLSRAVYDLGGDSSPRFGWVGDPTFVPAKQALVLRSEAQWRCDLPPGRYQVVFTLGDAAEWNCMYAAVGEQVLVAINRLLPGESRTVTAEVEVGSDRSLVIDIGLPQKSVLASSDGAVKNQTWIRLGRAIRNNPPALYLTPDAKLLVRYRVHFLQLPFFEQSTNVTRRLELLNSRGEWVPAGAVKIADDPVAYFPGVEANHIGGEEDRPEERTAREVSIEVPAAFGDGFAFASHVMCRAVAEPSDAVVAVPAYLVLEGDDGLFVQPAAAAASLRAVKGMRFDQVYLLEQGVAAGDRLRRPKAGEGTADAFRYTGEVVAATAVPMVVPVNSWARIEDLIPNGSVVKEGDLVVTLYRPEENASAVKSASKAVSAETTFLEAIDEQQAAFVAQISAQAQSLQEEKLAADLVAEQRRNDLAELAQAEESQKAIELEFALIEQRVKELAGSEATRLAYDEAKRKRDELRLKLEQQNLQRIASFRKRDFTVNLSQRFTWTKAKQELAMREAKIFLHLKQQDALGQKASSLLEDGVEDRDLGRDFDSQRHMKAPADGNVFYLTGYNDLAKRNERIDKEFVVWNGLTIANILDMSTLAFEIRFPETAYHRISLDMEVPIELEDLDGRILLGRVTKKGRSLYVPPVQNASEQALIQLNRVFDVTLKFSVPADLEDRLRPGLRGSVVLPE